MHHVKLSGYGGGMIWAVDLDDFNGACGEKWPLLNAMRSALTEDGSGGLQHPPPAHPEMDFVLAVDEDPDSTDDTDVFEIEPVVAEDEFACQGSGQQPLPNSCDKFAICRDKKLLHVQVMQHGFMKL